MSSSKILCESVIGKRNPVVQIILHLIGFQSLLLHMLNLFDLRTLYLSGYALVAELIIFDQ